MHKRSHHRFRSYRNLVITLVVASCGVMLLPSRWTGGWLSLLEVLVPFQDALTASADAAADALAGAEEDVPRSKYAELEMERDAVRRRNAALTMRIEDLEREIDLLTATRLWGGDDQRLGARGRLIPARVVTSDVLPWRSSRLINAGSSQGVHEGAPVVSRLLRIDRGNEDGVESGMAILLAEALIGIVEDAGPHIARMKLLSDATVEMKVRVGRFTDQGFRPTEGLYWLTGKGGERMEIRGIDRRDVESGLIKVGDVVLSDYTGGMLPAPMTIGAIAAILPDHEQPLLSIGEVRSSVDTAALRRVYVFDPGEGPEQ